MDPIPGLPVPVLSIINLVTQCLCIAVVTIFVGFRFFVRFCHRQSLQVEDYACLIAWTIFIAYCSTAIIAVKYGAGYHEAHVSAEDLVLFRKCGYILTVLYAPMALFVKIALLSILTRVFALYRFRTYFICGYLVLLCCYYFVDTFIKIFICHPIYIYWQDGAPTSGSCLNQRAVLLADSIISVVTDAGILVLPLPLTWSLQMSRAKKLRVIALLGAGGLATGFGLYRMVLDLRKGNSPDQTRFFTKMVLSGNAEIGIGLICACLPATNILVTRFMRCSLFSRPSSDDCSVQLQRVKTQTPASSHFEGFPLPRLHPLRPESHWSLMTTVSAGPDRDVEQSNPDSPPSEEISTRIHRTVAVSLTVETPDDMFVAEMPQSYPDAPHHC